MTEFKVGDRVRHKEFPSIAGEVHEVAGGFVYYKLDNGDKVGYRLEEVEHVRATEEDWEDDAWSSTDELAELRGWAKGVRDMAAAEKKSAPTGPYAASGYVGAFEDADPAPGLEKMVEQARNGGWISSFDEEVRVVNASTGGEKGQKLARFDLIPVGPLWQVAELYGQGATKYEDRNWEKGYDWSLSYAALMRHATLFWGGEDADPKDGNSHLASVVFHALALMDYIVNHPELDDRPKPKS